jgi:hypothetical protein
MGEKIRKASGDCIGMYKDLGFWCIFSMLSRVEKLICL